jgi:hypothetical protein
MGYGDFICESHIIKQYRLTVSIIEKFFGEPDATMPNPCCPSGNRRIKLFNKKRIELIMKSDEFQEYLAKSRKRSHKKYSWM